MLPAVNEYQEGQPKSSMFDPLPAEGSQNLDKQGLDKSSSKDLRQDGAMNSSSVQREIAAQESDRQLSFAGDNSFAN